MRRSAAVLSALLAVLLTGACSSTVTGSPAASSASGSAPSSAAEAAPAAPPVTATADPGAASGSDAAGASGSGSFCDAVRASVSQESGLADALTGGGDLNAVIAKIRASNDAVLAAAPPEIQPDVQTFYQLSNTELQLLASSQGNPAAFVQDSTFRDAVEKAAPATARLSAYLKSHCGIDVDTLAGLGGG